MGIIYTNSKNYENIADALRMKLQTTDQFSPNEMANAIKLILTQEDSIAFGDNLIIQDDIVADTYIDRDGTEVEWNNWSITNYIPVKQGKYYSINSAEFIGKNLSYSAFYDENKQYLRQINTADFETTNWIITLAIPEGVKYLRFSGTTNGVVNCVICEVNFN